MLCPGPTGVLTTLYRPPADFFLSLVKEKAFGLLQTQFGTQKRWYDKVLGKILEYLIHISRVQYELTESNCIIKTLITQFSTNKGKQTSQTIYHNMVSSYHHSLKSSKRKQITYITFFISSTQLQSSITSAYHQ